MLPDNRLLCETADESFAIHGRWPCSSWSCYITAERSGQPVVNQWSRVIVAGSTVCKSSEGLWKHRRQAGMLARVTAVNGRTETPVRCHDVVCESLEILSTASEQFHEKSADNSAPVVSHV